jgi:phosphoglucomutase
MTARTAHDPDQYYRSVTQDLGNSCYARIDAPATHAQKAALANFDPARIEATTLAGEPIDAKLTRAPGNNEPFGGIKVTAKSGWFAARPSGTEEVYKIYAESFLDETHLGQIQHDAQALIGRHFNKVRTGASRNSPPRAAR